MSSLFMCTACGVSIRIMYENLCSVHVELDSELDVDGCFLNVTCLVSGFVICRNHDGYDPGEKCFKSK